MEVLTCRCKGCGIELSGSFATSRLGSLSQEHQRFIEMFVLASGSLKAIAERARVSYPTVRSRLDRVIAALSAQIGNEGETTTEAAELAEEAARLLKKI